MIEHENTSPQAEEGDTSYLSEIIKGIMAASLTGEAPASDEQTSSANSTPKPSSGGGDLFSALLSNPELISKLPSLISGVKPILDMMSSRTSAPTAEITASQTSSLPTRDKFTDSKSTSVTDRRTALLCAMKPYLSQDRQNTVDYILKLSRLGDILKTL